MQLQVFELYCEQAEKERVDTINKKVREAIQEIQVRWQDITDKQAYDAFASSLAYSIRACCAVG